jgi:MFS family permease
VVAPLAPLFQPELGISKTQVGFFASAGYAGTWGVLLVAGSLADRYGVRMMMSVGQLLFGAFLLTMALTSDFSQAMVVMLAVGVGRGITVPSLGKGVADWFPVGQRGTAMGIKQTGVPVAGVITAATLPALGLLMGWRAAMAAVGVWIVFAALLSGLFYREVPQPRGRAPLRPSARAGVASVARVKKLWYLSVVSICFLVAQTSMNAYLALYLEDTVLSQTIEDSSSRIMVAGWLLALSQVGGTLGRIGWGLVSDRLLGGRRVPVMAGIGVFTALASFSTAFLNPEVPLWAIGALAFVFGANALGWNGLYQALITESVDRRYAATGVGFAMTLMQAGTVFGPPLFGLVVDTSGSYSAGWVFVGALCLIGVLLSLFYVKSERSPAR